MPTTPLVTITGTFTDVAGNLVSSGTVTAVLQGYGSDIPKIQGSSILDVTTVSATVSNGTFTLGPIYGNDVITPLTTFWVITMPAPNSNGAAGGTITKSYRITGSGTFDLSNLNPLSGQIVVNTPANSATPVVFSPISHQFITGMNSQGQFSSAQPKGSDLSDAALVSTTPVTWNADTGISRDAAGVIDVGNGTQGDKSGTVQTTQVIQAADAARISASGVFAASNKLVAFSSTAGSGGTPDAGISRTATNTLAIGNGSQGDITGSLQLGKIIEYNSIFTAGIGIAPIYAIVTSTGQTASIGSTTLYAVPASGAGLYRVSYSLVTTTGGTGGTAGLTINWNNGSNTASLGSGTIALGTLGSEVTSTLLLESGASQNITYSTTVSGATGNPQYSLRLRLEYLG